MQFLLTRAFARSLLIASFIAVVAAKATHAWGDAAVDDVEGTVDVKRFVPQPIAFSPCEENDDLECGTLTVSVDYRHPRGETTGIAVIRAPATLPDGRIGVLALNPGGPGFPGIDFVLGGVGAPIFQTVNARFDIVGFDPRGAGRSAPVKCEVEPAGDPAEVDPSQLAAFFDDFAATVASACLEQNGPFILSLSTNNVARDMDTLRRALGEEQISYVGLSAGTYLGATYATMFPERVRAMILDSGVMPEFHDNFIEQISEQSAGFELVLRHIEVLCAENASCPLRDRGVVAAFEELMARLAAAPVTSPRGGVLTDVEIRNVVAVSLYSESAWPTMVGALVAALDEEDYGFFFINAPLAKAGAIRIALDTTTFDSYDAMVCNDNGTRRPAAEHLRVDQTNAALFPHFFGRFYTSGEAARCGAWPPADEPRIRNVRGRVANPILFYGNDFDPATPLTWTRSLAHALGMDRNIVRYQGGGHGISTNNNPCIDEITSTYLFDLEVPPEGTTCAARFGTDAAPLMEGVRDARATGWSPFAVPR